MICVLACSVCIECLLSFSLFMLSIIFIIDCGFYHIVCFFEIGNIFVFVPSLLMLDEENQFGNEVVLFFVF